MKIIEGKDGIADSLGRKLGLRSQILREVGDVEDLLADQAKVINALVIRVMELEERLTWKDVLEAGDFDSYAAKALAAYVASADAPSAEEMRRVSARTRRLREMVKAYREDS